jgi:cyclic pyranopterin phosphate synthase
MRVSVTDRCNLRCVYCMPPEGVVWQPHASILSYEEIAQVVASAAQHGIREVRLTGGEPLVRKDLSDLVRLLSLIPGIKSLSLSTNGLLLASQAAELKQAGLDRVNVSLDTLDAEKFRRITRGGALQNVLDGIRTAEEAGLTPIKINVVAMRGVNEDELIRLAELALSHPWQVRFIELMPLVEQPRRVDQGLGSSPRHSYLPIAGVKHRLQPLHLQPAESDGNGPAKLFRIPGAPGRVGFISPISEHFCETCNRLRLTADGCLRPCLLSDTEVPIREAVRQGQDLLPFFQQAAFLKPQGHEVAINRMPGTRSMGQLGG